MSFTDIIHRPIMPLGSRTQVSSITYVRSTVLYDYSLADIPLLSAASREFPFVRGTAPFRKEQFDNSSNPGEQSLSNWWLRSQSSFHFGAGTSFMEPADDDEVMNSFKDSEGIDPWTPGELKLLKTTTLKNAGTGAIKLLGAIDGTTDIFLQAEGNTLARETASGSTAVTWGGSGTILSLAEDGANYYAADSTGIYKGTLAGGAGALAWNTGSSDVVVGWVKQRLVAGIGNKVYELVGGSPPTLPTALYTHPTASWKWTSITEGPSAIYLAGYAGAQSAIYKFTVSATGAMPTLTSGIIAATLPTGEIAHSIYAYLGRFIAIGTNKGVRIGIIDDDGDIEYGPLVIESTAPVYGFVGKDRFIFATCTNQIAGKSGLWRIDLSRQREDGRFPYATDLQSGVTGTVNSVSVLGASGRLVFGVQDSGSYLEHATDLVTSGKIRTGFIRFNTVEPKQFKYVSVRTRGTGTVAIETIDAGESAISLTSFSAASGGSGDVSMARPGSEQYLALRLTLTRDTASTGPTVTSWQIKALPASKRSRDLKVPVLLYEEMKDSKGARVTPVDINTVLQQLETYENNADTVNFTLLRHEPTLTESVTIEGIEFIQTTPPANAKGDGGIVYLSLRTVQ